MRIVPTTLSLVMIYETLATGPIPTLKATTAKVIPGGNLQHDGIHTRKTEHGITR